MPTDCDWLSLAGMQSDCKNELWGIFIKGEKSGCQLHLIQAQKLFQDTYAQILNYILDLSESYNQEFPE